MDALVRDGRLVRAGDRVTLPGAAAAAPDPALAAAMDRLESALAVAAPPALADAARAAGCPPEGVRALERDGRIVVLEPTLAYAAETYATLTAQALALADGRAADARRAARRDRHEPPVRHGDPRGPRPARDPPPHAGRASAGATRRVGRVGHDPMTTAAIVLAGGRSSRFGRDKLVEPVDGRADAGASRRRRGRHRGRGAGRGRPGCGAADPDRRPPRRRRPRLRGSARWRRCRPGGDRCGGRARRRRRHAVARAGGAPAAASTRSGTRRSTPRSWRPAVATGRCRWPFVGRRRSRSPRSCSPRTSAASGRCATASRSR